MYFMPYEIMTISSFYAHLFTVSEKKCEADSEKQHACHQLEGETYTGTYGDF